MSKKSDDLCFEVGMVILAIMMFGFFFGLPITMMVMHHSNLDRIEEVWVEIYPENRAETNWEGFMRHYYFVELPEAYEFYISGQKKAHIPKKEFNFSERLELYYIDGNGGFDETRKFKLEEGKIYIQMMQLPYPDLDIDGGSP